MIDIHSHLLPGIDDGSRSPAQSVRVLNTFARRGVTGVVLTPHVSAAEIELQPESALQRREDAFARLREVAEDSPDLHLGFEIMLDRPFPLSAIDDYRFALAESRYFLVEFPVGIPSSLAADALAAMTDGGIVPVVAHPERYNICTPDVVAAWRRMGAKMQVDATTLTQSTERGAKARVLLNHGLSDVVAADNHGGSRCQATAASYLAENGAAAQAALLTTENPALLIADQVMQAVAPTDLKETLFQRWKRITNRGQR